MNLELQDYIMLSIWVIIIVALLIVEFQTADLVSVWFIVGALFSGVSVLFNAKIWLQIVLFVIVSGICILATRPLAKKINSKDTIPTNIDSIINKVAIVTKEIKNGEKGEVKVDYKRWPAISNGPDFQVGDKVIVQTVIGNKLKVTKIEEIEII
jgi:membrane protein implicated in regulation of membrane protease activity